MIKSAFSGLADGNNMPNARDRINSAFKKYDPKESNGDQSAIHNPENKGFVKQNVGEASFRSGLLGDKNYSSTSGVQKRSAEFATTDKEQSRDISHTKNDPSERNLSPENKRSNNETAEKGDSPDIVQRKASDSYQPDVDDKQYAQTSKADTNDNNGHNSFINKLIQQQGQFSTQTLLQNLAGTTVAGNTQLQNQLQAVMGGNQFLQMNEIKGQKK